MAEIEKEIAGLEADNDDKVVVNAAHIHDWTEEDEKELQDPTAYPVKVRQVALSTHVCTLILVSCVRLPSNAWTQLLDRTRKRPFMPSSCLAQMVRPEATLRYWRSEYSCRSPFVG